MSGVPKYLKTHPYLYIRWRKGNPPLTDVFYMARTSFA
jgi:hypothetical protein